MYILNIFMLHIPDIIIGLKTVFPNPFCEQIKEQLVRVQRFQTKLDDILGDQTFFNFSFRQGKDTLNNL